MSSSHHQPECDSISTNTAGSTSASTGNSNNKHNANGSKRENVGETTTLLPASPSKIISNTTVFNPQLGKTYPSKNATFFKTHSLVG